MPVFALATVCHLFLASKVSYVLQVLHCLRVNLQKIHRVFAVFVGGSTRERTSSINLFLQISEDGLGLTRLFLRQLVNGFVFLRDVTDLCLRAVCQLRLGSVLSEDVVTPDIFAVE